MSGEKFYAFNNLVNGERKMWEKTLESKTIFQGKILNLREDQVLLPNGHTSSRLIVEHPGAVAVVPVTQNREIIMVEQFRKPVEQIMLEIPAGKLEKGEEPAKCAERELKEETGYRAGNLTKLTTFYSTPGFSDEIMHLYLATGLTFFEACPDEDEFVEAKVIPLRVAVEMIAQGEIKDAKTIIGILLAQQFLE